MTPPDTRLGMGDVLDQWPDVLAAATADGKARLAREVATYVDNGYRPPIFAGRARLEVERSRGKVERLVLTIDGKRYEAAKYLKMSQGRLSRTRSVFVSNELYDACCALGDWSEVARAALAEYVERRRAAA